MRVRAVYACVVVVFIGMIQAIYANAINESSKPMAMSSMPANTNTSTYSYITTTSTSVKTVTTTTTKPSSNRKTKYNFTKQDIHIIELVTMNEVGDCSEASKIAVANIVLNRWKSKEFPDTIKEIVYAKGQFTCSFSKQPNKSTKAAVQKALEGVDNSKGALYYYAPKYVKARYIIRWFESLDFCFELEGQRFFK